MFASIKNLVFGKRDHSLRAPFHEAFVRGLKYRCLALCRLGMMFTQINRSETEV
jgi:hypothetical protein